MQNKDVIPMLDIKAQHEPIKEEIKQALKDILDSGQFILGPNVRAFEQEIVSYCDVRNALGLASGTDALFLCLKALGLEKGDEVITTPFTFIATAEAIAYVGATPVFVDIDRHTLNIDSSKIEEKITTRTRAVIVVHLFGLPADMDEIMALAQKYNLKVVEDCAQAFGARYKNRPAGGIGDAGCFSFYPSKNLGAYGDGGMMVTNHHEIYESVRLLRNHGTVAPYRHGFIGYNSRLDEIQAAILRIKLRHIDEYNGKRRDLAKIYTSLLGDSVQCPVEIGDRTHVYHQYTIRTGERDRISGALRDDNVSSVVYYPVPLHMQEAFNYLGYRKGDLPESEAAADEVLSIPIYPELDPGKAEHIANVIVKALKA
ncbi:MAG: DegT/DnrJ/EryC1/StrS family aminotransferase [Nitrospiraceae bacterium]|nr:MAG: DegT/DnrJ/EryC1/StrS family aminotransferase [Nitrospiraceae bacterium]